MIRAASAGAALVALALALSGCDAAADTSPVPSNAPVEAGRFTEPGQLGSALVAAARAAGTARGSVDAVGDQGSVRGEVAYDFSADVRLSAQVSVSGPIDADLAVVMDGTEPGDVVYIEVPALFRLFVAQPWVRVVRGDGSDAGGVADDLTDALAAEVPGEWLLGLDDRAGLTYAGTATVSGTVVEKFEAEGILRGDEVRRTYWVDEDDLLHRLDTVVDGSGTSTNTYGGWGEPVTVVVPDPSDVADLPAGLF